MEAGFQEVGSGVMKGRKEDWKGDEGSGAAGRMECSGERVEGAGLGVEVMGG